MNLPNIKRWTWLTECSPDSLGVTMMRARLTRSSDLVRQAQFVIVVSSTKRNSKSIVNLCKCLYWKNCWVYLDFFASAQGLEWVSVGYSHGAVVADVVVVGLPSESSGAFGQTTTDFVSSCPDHLCVVPYDMEVIFGRAVGKVVLLTEPHPQRKKPGNITRSVSGRCLL